MVPLSEGPSVPLQSPPHYHPEAQSALATILSSALATCATIQLSTPEVALEGAKKCYWDGFPALPSTHVAATSLSPRGRGHFLSVQPLSASQPVPTTITYEAQCIFFFFLCLF